MSILKAIFSGGKAIATVPIAGDPIARKAIMELIVAYAKDNYDYPDDEARFFAELFVDMPFSGLDPQLEAFKQMGYPRPGYKCGGLG